MKPKITDFVNCDHLLFSLSCITLIEVTINQWHDATLRAMVKCEVRGTRWV